MGSAIGGSSGGSSGSAAELYVTRVPVSIWDGVPGSEGNFAEANSVALQAAHDAATTLADGSAWLELPAGKIYLKRPFLIHKNKLGLRGQGRGLTEMYSAGHHDVIVLGMDPTPSPSAVVATSDHFPDIFTAGPGSTPRLDSTAVTATGQKYALRTKGDSHAAQQGGPLDRGPIVSGAAMGWRDCRQLTIDFAVEFHAHAAFPGAGSIMGMVDGAAPCPFYLTIVSGTMRLNFGTTDVAGANLVNRYISFGTFTTATLYRVSLQIDLVNAAITAHVNGVQVAVEMGAVGANFTSGAGLYFRENTHVPFGIGSTHTSANYAADQVGAAIDATFYGLRLFSGLIYANGATGSAQARLDAAAITDASRYFNFATGEVCRLLMTATPADLAANRLVDVTSTSNAAYKATCFWYTSGVSGSPNWSLSAGPVQDMSIIKQDPAYGRAISALSVNLGTYERMYLRGGHQALACINGATSFPWTMHDLDLVAGDAGLYLYNAGWPHLSGFSLVAGNSGGAGMRFVACSRTKIEDGHLGSSGTPKYHFWFNGCGGELTHISQDYEDVDGGATHAYIYASCNQAGDIRPIGADLRMSYVSAGRFAPGAAIVLLEDGMAEDGELNRPGIFAMEFCGIEDSYFGSVVKTTGKRWRGRIQADLTVPRPRWIENADPAADGRITVEHAWHTGPPRDGFATRNADILRAPNPAVGQHREWRPTATGSYGTAAPPVWIGSGPIDDGLSLAAYVQDNTYWTVPSMPTGSMGFWSDSSLALFLNAYFGGSMPATPAALYFGLGYRRVQRNPLVVEMAAAGGYARAAGGTFTLASGGASNAATITFPTASANWFAAAVTYETFNALLIYDALTGGNYLGAIDIPPRKVLSGQTVSYTAGQVATARAPSPLGSFSDSVHDLLDNFWLNRATFTSPAALYVALSTGPATDAAPTEPVGGGYARQTVTAATWNRRAAALNMRAVIGETGIVTNAAAITFGAPSGDWGTVRSVYLMSAPTGGSVLARAALTVPRAITSGSGARSFAAEALHLQFT